MTILGRHTVHETKDYIKSLDFRFDKYNEAFKTLPANAADPAFVSLARDWTNIYHKWKIEAGTLLLRLHAAVLSNPLVSTDLIPAESEWNAADAFHLKGKEPGGMHDCEFRIEKMLGHAVDIDTNRPLQNAPDVDLGGFKKLDASIKEGEAAAKAAGTSLGNAVKSPWGVGLIIGGVAIAGVAGYIYTAPIRAIRR